MIIDRGKQRIRYNHELNELYSYLNLCDFKIFERLRWRMSNVRTESPKNGMAQQGKDWLGSPEQDRKITQPIRLNVRMIAVRDRERWKEEKNDRRRKTSIFLLDSLKANSSF